MTRALGKRATTGSGDQAAVNVSRAGVRAGDRWLAVLRIGVGLWFLKSLFTKLAIGLVGGIVPVPVASERWLATMPRLLAKYAADNPFPLYKAFLLHTVIPQSRVFATLTALGEVAVGIGLVFGLVTALVAALGFVQVVFYGLAVQHTSPGQQGFHLLLALCMIAFAAARVGRVWGLDGWLRSRYPRSLFARLPLG